MKSLVYILLLLTVISCQPSKKEPYKLPENAKALLTGTTTKTWKLARRFNGKTRMNMGDCFLSYRQIYQADRTMRDNNGEQRDCGETLKANWQFAKDKSGNAYLKLNSKQIPALMNVDKDYKLFKILHLSDEQMTLQFKHKQFSDKTTLITDIYVPEHVEVGDRKFHW